MKKKTTRSLCFKYKPALKNALAYLLSVVGKKERFIHDFNTALQLNLDLTHK